MKRFRKQSAIRIPRSATKPGSAFALVVVLSTIVLITVLVLAFFSRALLNRQVSFSSTNQIKADILARSAMEIVTGELRQEIVDQSDAASGTFRPKTDADNAPAKLGVTDPDADLGQYTIAKVAAPGAKLNSGASGIVMASDAPITAASLNGRTQTRWFSAGPNLGTAALPSWAYLTRTGGVVAEPVAANVSDPAGPDYVIGRFSYTVYQTGGLLDANLAGYPNTVTPSAAGTKTSIAYADLKQLGWTEEQVQDFVKWRNQRTSTSPIVFNQWVSGIREGTSELDELALNAARSGHRDIVLGDNVFFSRRDLLRYLKSAGVPADSHGYFTHFTRSNRAPGWGPSAIPGSTIDYVANADSAAGTNRFLPGVPTIAGTIRRYADDGTYEEVEVLEGESLVARRFSLARLAWLGHDGPNAAAFSPDIPAEDQARAIKDCFGLTWNQLKKRWDYDHGDAHFIQTLDEVRAASREPDFFELLKAGILEGSLGGHPGAVAVNVSAEPIKPETHSGPMGMDFEAYSADKERHILQIGANIIDQADADNYPTAIYLEAFDKYEEDDLYNCVFGVENLPYLARVGIISCYINLAHGTEAMDKEGEMGVWIQPELWNPHNSASAGNAPTKLRMVTYGGAQIQNLTYDPTASRLSERVDFGFNPDAPKIDGIVPFKNPAADSKSPEAFYNRPVMLTGYVEEANGNTKPWAAREYSLPGETAGPLNRHPVGWTAQNWTNTINRSEFLGVWMGKVMHIPEPHDPANPTQVKRVAHSIMLLPDPYLTFALEYHDGSGWRPYTVMARITTFPRQGYSSNTSYGRPSWAVVAAHTDPRTDRFGMSRLEIRSGSNRAWRSSRTIRQGLNRDAHAEAGANDGRGFIIAAWPRAEAGFVHTPKPESGGAMYFFDEWMQNLSTSEFRYMDPDGVVRPGDGLRAIDGNSSTGDGHLTFHFITEGTTNTPYLPNSIPRRRAVVLNRPFRSVGELGYVYRDLPFKSLDFWSKDSADAGLLDIFSVADAQGGIAIGDVNHNAAPPKVLKALLAGTDTNAMSPAADELVTAEEAAAGAAAIAGDIVANGPVLSAGRALTRPADNLQTKLNDAITLPARKDAFKNKTHGEAAARALGNVANTRTWNLMIDVVAQVGRLRKNAPTLQAFTVEGERRYWMHLALDRYTGQVLDSQLEPVYE